MLALVELAGDTAVAACWRACRCEKTACVCAANASTNFVMVALFFSPPPLRRCPRVRARFSWGGASSLEPGSLASVVAAGVCEAGGVGGVGIEVIRSGNELREVGRGKNHVVLILF